MGNKKRCHKGSFATHSAPEQIISQARSLADSYINMRVKLKGGIYHHSKIPLLVHKVGGLRGSLLESKINKVEVPVPSFVHLYVTAEAFSFESFK